MERRSREGGLGLPHDWVELIVRGLVTKSEVGGRARARPNWPKLWFLPELTEPSLFLPDSTSRTPSTFNSAHLTTHHQSESTYHHIPSLTRPPPSLFPLQLRTRPTAPGRLPPLSARCPHANRPYVLSQMVHTIDLAGKNVLITGGGRGLGVDIARTFAKAGANLVLTCTHTPRLPLPRL